MEFSYKINEAEYLSAAKPKSKASSVIKSVLFWIVIMVSLMFLIWLIQPQTPQPVIRNSSTQHTAFQAFLDYWTLPLSIGLLLFISISQPMILRRQYRRDPLMLGQFTVNITPESISTQNTAGTSIQYAWNRCVFWYEVKDVVVLLFRRPYTRFLISLAGLSEAQRNELRGILAASLPKKRDLQ